MKTNFEIKDNYAVSYDGRHIDLHNNFDFVSFDYNLIKKQLTLKWIKSTGDWIKGNELDRLTFLHKNVSYLTISDSDELSQLADDTCLGEITFFPSTAREINDSIIPQARPNLDDDILYHFENGQSIRTCCENIELICD